MSKKWSESEIDYLVQNYEYGNLDEISKKINRTKAAISKFASKKLGITHQLQNIFIDKESLINGMKESHSYSELLRSLNKVVNGTNLKLVKKYIKKYDISENTMILKVDRKNRKPKTINEWLQKGSTISSCKLKEKLYKEGLKERICEKCGQTENWNGEYMSLILDHINGISNDNRIENLRILCPNCNATLPTHCKGYKYKEIEKNKEKRQKLKEEYKKQSEERILNAYIKQRKVERPSYEQLLKDIKELGYRGTGRKYGVADNSIRKWVKFYEKYK